MDSFMAYTTSDIRNICLVGPGGAGKTLLTEALLHAAGAIPQCGAIERGDTVSPFSVSIRLSPGPLRNSRQPDRHPGLSRFLRTCIVSYARRRNRGYSAECAIRRRGSRTANDGSGKGSKALPHDHR